MGENVIQGKLHSLKYALEGELSKRGIDSRVSISYGADKQKHESHLYYVNIMSSHGNSSFCIWKFNDEDSDWYWQSKDLNLYTGG